MRSIQHFLFLSLFIIAALATGSSALWSYDDAQHEVEELFDAQLAEFSRVLAKLVENEASALEGEWVSGNVLALLNDNDDDDNGEEMTYGHKYEKKISYQILDSNGELLARSASAPDYPIEKHTPGYSNFNDGEHHWRLFMLIAPDSGLRFIVSERDDVRGEYIDRILIRVITPMLLSFPVMMLLVWLAIRLGFQPLTRLGKSLAQREVNNLSPIDPGGVPTEIHALVTSINDLLQKLQNSFIREKRFTADAAHELRTPLAALQIHVENALQAGEQQERTASLEKVLSGVHRMTHVIQQLLTLSRLEPDVVTLDNQTFNLVAVARETLSELAPLAIRKHINLSLQPGSDSCQIQGDPAPMMILVRNLVDNAIRYIPVAGVIVVSIESHAGCCRLRVSDNGPGIPAAIHDKVFERFFRAPESGEEGSGLGLSIVQRIVDLYQARLELTTGLDGSGLSVVINFPPK